jgi:hypothetical protein
MLIRFKKLSPDLARASPEFETPRVTSKASLVRRQVAISMAYSNPLLRALIYDRSSEQPDLLGHGDAFIAIVPPLEPKDELMVDQDFLGSFKDVGTKHYYALNKF